MRITPQLLRGAWKWGFEWVLFFEFEGRKTGEAMPGYGVSVMSPRPDETGKLVVPHIWLRYRHFRFWRRPDRWTNSSWP